MQKPVLRWHRLIVAAVVLTAVTVFVFETSQRRRSPGQRRLGTRLVLFSDFARPEPPPIAEALELAVPLRRPT